MNVRKRESFIAFKCVKKSPDQRSFLRSPQNLWQEQEFGGAHWLTWTDDLPLTRRLLYHWAKRANREPEFYTFFWVCVEPRPQEVKRCKNVGRLLPLRRSRSATALRHLKRGYEDQNFCIHCWVGYESLHFLRSHSKKTLNRSFKKSRSCTRAWTLGSERALSLLNA